MTLPISDRLQISVKALDELSDNKRLAASTRLALLEASDNIVAVNEAVEELVEALTKAVRVLRPQASDEERAAYKYGHAILAKISGDQ